MHGPTIFLHIPKTAGQTIHSELERVIGKDATSPVRVHTQAKPGAEQFPAGYKLYSGHINWDALNTLPEPRFVFTVLRDPLERIASFYFYICRQAEQLSADDLMKPQFTGMRMARERTIDEYFCGGPSSWKAFIRDHYHSTYCAYLVSRRLRGFSYIKDMPRRDLIKEAVNSAKNLNGIYTIDDLSILERDMENWLGKSVSLTRTYMNAAPNRGIQNSRWSRLENLIQRDETYARLQHFARADRILMHRLELGPNPT